MYVSYEQGESRVTNEIRAEFSSRKIQSFREGRIYYKSFILAFS